MASEGLRLFLGCMWALFSRRWRLCVPCFTNYGQKGTMENTNRLSIAKVLIAACDVSAPGAFAWSCMRGVAMCWHRGSPIFALVLSSPGSRTANPFNSSKQSCRLLSARRTTSQSAQSWRRPLLNSARIASAAGPWAPVFETFSGMEMRPRKGHSSRKTRQYGRPSARRAINLETLSRFMPREIGACVCLCVPCGGLVAVGCRVQGLSQVVACA